jgi:hypothetical protein
VTVISVGDEFDEKGSLISDAPLLGELHCFTNDQNVLTVNFEAWDGISSGIEFGIVRGTFIGCSHTIEVIFANIKNG